MEKLYGLDTNDILLPNLVIPSLTDKELEKIYRQLKPIATVDEIKYYLKEYSLQQLRYYSYMQDFASSISERLDSSLIDPIDEFICLHKFDYYGSFTPTIAEVLSQVPEHLIDDSNAFEIVEYPTKMADVARYFEAFEKGYHLSKVRTYKIKNENI